MSLGDTADTHSPNVALPTGLQEPEELLAAGRNDDKLAAHKTVRQLRQVPRLPCWRLRALRLRIPTVPWPCATFRSDTAARPPDCPLGRERLR